MVKLNNKIVNFLTSISWTIRSKAHHMIHLILLTLMTHRVFDIGLSFW